MMRTAFAAIASHLKTRLLPDEHYTLWLSAEQTDFVRFNHGKVRQAGQVSQAYLTLTLVRGQRHASEQLSISGNADDLALVDASLLTLRGALDEIEDDPYLLLNTTPQSSERADANVLPASETMVADIVAAAGDADLVGILAAGPVYYGFANSYGQFNWQASSSWNFDWSLYAHGDKAVKRGSAGTHWSAENIAADIAEARTQLDLLRLPAKTLTPGSYRAYLTPSAVAEIAGMLNWGGLSEKQLRAKKSPLLKLAEGEQSFSPKFTLLENTGAGLAPAFQAEGFIRPAQVALVQNGKLAGSLISPRSAKEYGIEGNGASSWESSESMDMAGGDLPTAEVLQALGTGLYISNLWYLNFSDRAAGRITGMTRFACFWVENGQIVAPLNVMRFDDSLFRILGSELEALTSECELLVDPGSYGARSSASQRLPGALLRSLNLVL
ncbi:TldD/PmbA family protein [Chitinimonas sp. BJYL2]|uniref:TldD/PmbA family protein n=1 Tax=Chitinimonas sp. BJYL2 TaxID=2976696 RepID=UPI0022B521CE|nr:metallopeptidase TldD-related protein [Chitinimonas sp. BJYL2]